MAGGCLSAGDGGNVGCQHPGGQGSDHAARPLSVQRCAIGVLSPGTWAPGLAGMAIGISPARSNALAKGSGIFGHDRAGLPNPVHARDHPNDGWQHGAVVGDHAGVDCDPLLLCLSGTLAESYLAGAAGDADWNDPGDCQRRQGQFAFGFSLGQPVHVAGGDALGCGDGLQPSAAARVQPPAAVADL